MESPGSQLSKTSWGFETRPAQGWFLTQNFPLCLFLTAEKEKKLKHGSSSLRWVGKDQMLFARVFQWNFARGQRAVWAKTNQKLYKWRRTVFVGWIWESGEARLQSKPTAAVSRIFFFIIYFFWISAQHASNLLWTWTGEAKYIVLWNWNPKNMIFQVRRPVAGKLKPLLLFSFHFLSWSQHSCILMYLTSMHRYCFSCTSLTFFQCIQTCSQCFGTTTRLYHQQNEFLFFIRVQWRLLPMGASEVCWNILPSIPYIIS